MTFNESIIEDAALRDTLLKLLSADIRVADEEGIAGV